MKFSEMILKDKEEIKDINISADFEVNRLRYNSKSVESGDVFFAIKGVKSDGNDYIEEAFSNGAKAAFTDEVIPLRDKRIYKVEDSRKAMAVMSGVYYDNPSEKMTMI